MKSSKDLICDDLLVSLPDVRQRALLSLDESTALMRLFKIFANDTRLRLLHALVREGELCVTDLAASVDMKPQAVSNQLQRLAKRGILSCRREGKNVYYQVVDPCVPVLIQRGLCLVTCHSRMTAERYPNSLEI